MNPRMALAQRAGFGFSGSRGLGRFGRLLVACSDPLIDWGGIFVFFRISGHGLVDESAIIWP